MTYRMTAAEFQLWQKNRTGPKKEIGGKATDEKLWKVFSLFIRLKFSDQNGICKCYTCGRRLHYKNADAGHGIPRQHKATKFDENNVRPQCRPENAFEGGAREKFKAAMDKEHGPGTWDLMELKSRTVCHRSQFEIEALIKHYSAEVKKLKKEKGIV